MQEAVFLAERGELISNEVIDNLVDLFAGCGGSGGGLLDANEILGRQVRGTFVNHWDKAIKIHSANHPEHRHLEEDLFLLNPEGVFPVGTDCSLLWASPQCTHFSVARGASCVNEQERSHAFTVTDWVRHLNPEGVVCENVKEFRDFGPTMQKREVSGPCKGELMWALNAKPVYSSYDKAYPKRKLLPKEHRRAKDESEEAWIERMTDEGYKPYEVPDKSRKGEYFDAWLAEMDELGYDVDHRILKSADYGDPTIRQRLFIYFVRRDTGKKIVWPEPYAQDPKKQEDDPRPMNWLTARQCIDWSLKGESVFTRDKKLADNTFRRLAIGLVKYGLKDYLISSAHADGHERRVHSTDEPLRTLTQKGERGLVKATGEFLSPNFGERPGQTPRTHSVDAPVPTVTSHGAGGVVETEAFILPKDGGHKQDYVRGVDHPVGGITTKSHEVLVETEAEAFVVPHNRGHDGDRVRSVDEPVSTITTNHRGEGVAEADVEEVDGDGASIIQMKGKSTAQDPDDPLTSITSNQSHYVSQPDVDEVDRACVIQLQGTSDANDLDAPMTAQTTKPVHGLSQPKVTEMVDNQRGTGVCKSADEPLRSPTAGGNHQALAEAFMFAIDQSGGERKNDGTYPVDEPVRTLVTKANQSCIEMELEEVSDRFLSACGDKGVDTERATTFLGFLIDELKRRGKVNAKPWIYVYYSNGSEGKDIDEPLPAVRTKAGHALVYPVVEMDGKLLKIDLFYRMLTPLELQRAMGFPDDMEWAGVTKTETIRAIGNSVSRGVSRALGLAWYSQDSDVWPKVKHFYQEAPNGYRELKE